MPQTHLQITSAREYFDEIVEPDFADAMASPASLRAAFHCASSLYHLHEFVFADHGKQLGYQKSREFDDALCAKSKDFQLVRDIANTAKHMELDRDPKRITHIANTTVQSTGFGEGAYGSGPFGGTPRVRVHVAPNTDEEFSSVATAAMTLWRQMFAQHGW